LKPLRPARHFGLLQLKTSDPEWEAEFKRRFAHLVAHYRLSDTADLWPELALKLIWDFVPGLRQPRNRRGRPRDDSQEARDRRARLLTHVEMLRGGNPAIKDLSACKRLSERRATEFAGENPETLRKWLRVARKEREEKARYNAIMGGFLSQGTLFGLAPNAMPPIDHVPTSGLRFGGK
jgi:hypothetical protein